MSSGSSSFELIVQEKHKEYQKWVPIYCPSLNQKISFNSRGFTHLRFRIDGTARNPKEVIYKLNLLDFVRNIVSKAQKIDEYRKRIVALHRKGKIKQQIEYWSITGFDNKQEMQIKVILRKVGTGNIHFWSVMKL